MLGALIHAPQILDSVQSVGLVETDFYRPSHRLIYRTVLNLFDQRGAVDELTVIAALEAQGKLEEAGGRVAVATLVENVPAVANARHYAKIVRDQSVLRHLVNTGHKIAQLGYEHPDEPTRLVDTAEQLIFDLAHQRQSTDFMGIHDLLPEIYDEIAERAENGTASTGVPSGFRDFDKLTGGFQPSNLIIVGARASMGKTSWALNVAEHVALREKRPVAVFSLEMSRKELAVRMMCSVAKVDQTRVRIGKPMEDDWPRLVDAVGQLAEAEGRIFIDETPFLSPMELRSKARRKHREVGLGLIVIDYLQLMDPGMRIENRQEQISYISRSLKSLARELNVPIIALSQLSRMVEQRNDKRPMLSDLRESGAIEQDADLVIFIHRPEYYDRDNPEVKGKAEIIIAKHRNGRTGSVDVAFLDKYTKFVDLAKPHQVQGAPAAPPSPNEIV